MRIFRFKIKNPIELKMKQAIRILVISLAFLFVASADDLVAWGVAGFGEVGRFTGVGRPAVISFPGNPKTSASGYMFSLVLTGRIQLY
jgi:hypothetical protein